MLSDQAFEQWYLRLVLSDQGKALITQICLSPPARSHGRILLICNGNL